MYATFINWYTFTIRTFKHNSDLSPGRSLHPPSTFTCHEINVHTVHDNRCLRPIDDIKWYVSLRHWSHTQLTTDNASTTLTFRLISSSTTNFCLPRNQHPYHTWQLLLTANHLMVCVSSSSESYTTDNWQRLRSLTYLSFKIYRNTAFCHLFLHNHPSTSPVSTPIMHDLYLVCRLSLAWNSPLVPRNNVSLLYFILSSFTNLFLDD